MTLMLCASLSCSSVMAAEKDVGEAIQSVATLPNIQKLKPEQEQSLIPTGSFDFPASSVSGQGVG